MNLTTIFISVAALAVQVIIAVLLRKYARDTWKLRKASQKQNEIMQMPCLVLLVRRREDIDIVADGVAGIPYPEERILDGEWSGTGHVALHNIGDGPAFNIHYEVQKQEGVTGTTGQGSLPYILQGEREPILQVPDNLDPGDDDKEVGFKLSYEGHNGCRYDGGMYIRRGTRGELVVTKCQFPHSSGNSVSERAE